MKINKIVHNYENFTLNIENITINNNKVIGLVGENGAGKTTLMDILSQMIKANDTFDVDSYRGNDILYIPSDITPYNFLKVNEFCDIVISYSNSSRDPDEVMTELGLEDKKDVLISKLSQGMKKKLTLINLLLDDYSLVVLDEPFNSVDLQYSYEIKDIIMKLKENSTVLISSHIVDSLIDICDDFIFLKDGSVHKVFENTGNKKELEAELFD